MVLCAVEETVIEAPVVPWWQRAAISSAALVRSRIIGVDVVTYNTHLHEFSVWIYDLSAAAARRIDDEWRGSLDLDTVTYPAFIHRRPSGETRAKTVWHRDIELLRPWDHHRCVSAIVEEFRDMVRSTSATHGRFFAVVIPLGSCKETARDLKENAPVRLVTQFTAWNDHA